MELYTVTQHGRFTDTKRAGLKWQQAVEAAESFVNASTTDTVKRETLMESVMNSAGEGEPVALPNGKTLEIDITE